MKRKQLLATMYGLGLAALVSVPALAQNAAGDPAKAPQTQPAGQAATTPQSQPAAKPAPAPQAKPATKAKTWMKYDAKNEVTVTGTVEAVKTPTGKSASWGPESVTLKTDAGMVDVHLAPADYWTKNGFELTKGASISATGSKTQMGNSVVILARTVTAGDKTVTLRSAEGAPAWAHPHVSKKKS